MRYRTIVQSFIFLISYFSSVNAGVCKTRGDRVKKRNLIFYNVHNSVGRSGRSRKKKKNKMEYSSREKDWKVETKGQYVSRALFEMRRRSRNDLLRRCCVSVIQLTLLFTG